VTEPDAGDNNASLWLDEGDLWLAFEGEAEATESEEPYWDSCEGCSRLRFDELCLGRKFANFGMRMPPSFLPAGLIMGSGSFDGRLMADFNGRPLDSTALLLEGTPDLTLRKPMSRAPEEEFGWAVSNWE
jgi:hypothetical protein